jgi:hypothetical protein
MTDDEHHLENLTDREKYEYALWAQKMDRQIERNLIADDGSVIEWHDEPLSGLSAKALKALLAGLGDATCFGCIDRAKAAVRLAIETELASRRKPVGRHALLTGVAGGRSIRIFIPDSPSDWRAGRNLRGDIRRAVCGAPQAGVNREKNLQRQADAHSSRPPKASRWKAACPVKPAPRSCRTWPSSSASLLRCSAAAIPRW